MIRSASRYAIALVVIAPSSVVTPTITASRNENATLRQNTPTAAISHSVSETCSWRSGIRSAMRRSAASGSRSSTSQRRVSRKRRSPQTVPIAHATST